MSTSPLIFVTGKGGVGKSTISAAIALREAQDGKKTLLVELGERSFFQQWFDVSVDHQPTALNPSRLSSRLWVARWDGPQCLKEYLLHYLKVEGLVNLFFENKVMRTLIQAAPALKEIALIGKITSGIRKVGPRLDFERIVVDCFSTGHFQALIRAPKGLAQAVQFGPMGEQCRAMTNILLSPEQSTYVIVTLPEELPVAETIELQHFFLKEMDIEARIALNRILTIPKERLPESSEFLSYLQAIESRQTASYQELEKFKPTIIPQFFTTQPQELLEQVTAAVRSL